MDSLIEGWVDQRPWLIRLLLSVAVCVIAAAAALWPAPARAEPWKWEHWGAAPFAQSRAEAMNQREEVLRKLDFPPKVIPVLLKAMENPGSKTLLSNGYRFVAQIGRGGEVHGLGEDGGVVAFSDHVPGKIEHVAVVERWEVTVDEVIYRLDLPAICFNFTRGVNRRPPPAPPVSAASAPSPTASAPQPAPPPACPDVYVLKVNVWQRGALDLPGVAATHERESTFRVEFGNRVRHVSRIHGGQFRQAAMDGVLARSRVSRLFRVSLIMTPEATGGDGTISQESVVVPAAAITGLRELRFTASQVNAWDAIRVIALDEGILSPPRYGGTTLHELRFFNHLPGTRLGEWENNPVRDCIMNEHWIEE